MEERAPRRCPRWRPHWMRLSRPSQRVWLRGRRLPPPSPRRLRGRRRFCSPRSRRACCARDAKRRTPTDLCARARTASLVMDRASHGTAQDGGADSFSLPSSTFAMSGIQGGEKTATSESRGGGSNGCWRSSGRCSGRASATSRLRTAGRSKKLRSSSLAARLRAPRLERSWRGAGEE
jgi:hypothetical protein